MARWFPTNVSTFGAEIDSVFWLIFYVGLVWFILAEGLILFFVLRYRRRRSPKATFADGSRARQLAWILVPGAIVLLLDLGVDFAGGHAFEAVKGEAPEPDVRVRITGEQFAWNMTYAGPDEVFDTTDDVTSLFELHVPAQTTVGVILASKDVIHSLFIPQLRLKQDALPGREIPVWFEVTEPGQYEIFCAELCGFGHYKMRGLLTAHSAEDYEAWVRETWPADPVDAQ